MRVESNQIEDFLSGTNPMKYVVGIEANYNNPFVYVIINDPLTGKRTEKHPYQPFLWFKEDVARILYGGNKLKAMEAAQKLGIKSKRLTISDSDGNIPKRLQNGYKYLATCSKSYNDLVRYFKDGGIDVFSKDTSKLFFMFSPVEQFMIQTGIRMFKGMDDYNDMHKFQFDLETEGLSAEQHGIFQIGMRDNRGFEYVLEVKGRTPQDRRNSEREVLKKFFKAIDYLKPDIIEGYNSESFDWDFIVKRCERLSIDVEDIAICLDGESKFRRKPAMLKLGNEMEPYTQTYMFGYNIIDIAHSVRRAQAINSEIKSWGLKYITKYSEIEKKNRVYVPGDKIHTTWSDTVNQYAFNDVNGDWYKISDIMPLKEGYTIVKGDYIVQRYLLDDLWETEQVGTIFNQAAFLIAKLLPTTYSRSSTMGTASQWKLIMAAWSYQNNLAIPETEPKRDFTGGLSRLLALGYARNVVKLDYAALYPKVELTHGIFPDLDISGVMEGLLTYVVDTRDKFKFLTGKHKKLVKKLKAEIEENKDTYTKEQLDALEKELTENKVLENLYNKKQLPLKILANSWFGAYGAPYIFNWGASDCAEETTCRGRQYLRLMVKHFSLKYGFEPLVGDTDGFNFAFPDDIDKIKYTAKGSHWKTTNYANQELSGLEAVLAEFNENYMMGRMGLDIDDICNSTINFSRKNYANDINGKVKLVGNSIKSKKMPVYIEDFLNKGIRQLLDGRGSDFIQSYYEHVDLIYNYNIPIVKIASKSKVKSSISEYKKRMNKTNKKGNPMPRQAHMELAILGNLELNLGDTLFYVNTGTSKSQGDLKSVIKEGVKKLTKAEATQYIIDNGHKIKYPTELQINCELIDSMIVETNMEMIKEIEVLKKILSTETDAEKIENIEAEIANIESQLHKGTYNVAKYLEAFNKKVKPLLVCFNPNVRSKILLTIKKDKKTKLESLTERSYFTEIDSQLVSGMPNNPEDQDTFEELMTMEDKEIKFWTKVDKIPNNMTEEEFEAIKVDYFERKRIEKLEGIEHEKTLLDDFFRHIEYPELIKYKEGEDIPFEMFSFADLNFENGDIVSRKWEAVLGNFRDILKYEAEIIQRNQWYTDNNCKRDDRYEQWVDYRNQQEVMGGENQGQFTFVESTFDVIKSVNKVREKLIEKQYLLFVDNKLNTPEEAEIDEIDKDEIEDEEPFDDFSPELQKFEFNVELDTIDAGKFDFEEKEDEDEWSLF